MIVALDTMTMLWGILGLGNAVDEEKRVRARILIRHLDSEEPKPAIIVSSIVVAELLTGMNVTQKADFLSALASDFEIAPFDLKSSALASKLYDNHRELRTKTRHDRTIFRIDTLIIASSKAAGATVFYSHDERARKMASTVMTARDLPTHSETFDWKN